MNSVLILKVQNNTYEEETFDVINTSTARTDGLRKLTLVLQGGQFEPLWFIGQQFPDELIKPAKRKSTMTQFSYVTKKHRHHHHHHHHHHKQNAQNDVFAK